MKATPVLSFTTADKVKSLIRKKPDISLEETAAALDMNLRTLHRHILKDTKTTFREIKKEILTELNDIRAKHDIPAPIIPVLPIKKSTKKTTKKVITPSYDSFDDFDDLGEESDMMEPIDPVNIPKEITTELIEQETLIQYYNSSDPKDKQRLLSIMQSIWAVKHKVPTENTNKTQSMEDLLARLS